MDADVPERERFATIEARLQLLEDRIGQLETQMRESLTVVYGAESLHARVLAKLAAAVRVLQRLVERIYRMMQQKRGGLENAPPSSGK